ncbi:putative ribonuclease H-like domain-containing protein [Tanacetum coccineum]
MAKPDDEDINLKFLRVEGDSWNRYQRIFYSSQVQSLKPFLHFSKARSYSSGNVLQDVLYSLVAESEPEQQVAYEDFEQIYKLDLEEMISNGNGICWHFARECRAKGGNEQRYSSFKIQELGKKEADTKALITVDTLENWKEHESGDDEGFAPKEYGMVAGCGAACEEGAAEVYSLITGNGTDAAAGEFALMGMTSEVQAYKNSLKTLEKQKRVYQQNQLGYEEKIRVLSIELENTTNLLKHSERINVEAEIAKKDLQTKLDNHLAKTEKWAFFSKNLCRPLFSRFAKADSMKVLPPPLSKDYTPLSDHIDLDESQMSYGTKSSTSEPSQRVSILCIQLNVFTSESEAEIESKVGTPIQEPILLRIYLFFVIVADKNENTSRTFVLRMGGGKTNQFVPQAVRLRSGKVSIPAARPNQVPASSPKPVPTGRPKPVSTGKQYRPPPVHAGRRNYSSVTSGLVAKSNRDGWATIVKPSSGCSWKTYRNKVYGVNLHTYAGDEGIVDSGCSRSMTGNKERLDDFQSFKVAKVDFLEMVKGRINWNKDIRTPNTDCLVLSNDFKLPDESMVLLRVPRKHNLYTFNLNNLAPKENLACLMAKASSDEAVKWHRRMGHVNYKNMNKLVKDNLVRAFEICINGTLGPTSFEGIRSQIYCLVITDDYSRFCWVFFLETKDETYPILKDFISLVENQLNKKVKAIRCDNGTEFKNANLIELCGEKGIKRDYSNARTPQQNGVAERKNRTLIEATRTMLADSKLATMFWTEAVRTQDVSSNPAGFQDDDSDSNSDEQVILVPSYPSNNIPGAETKDTSDAHSNDVLFDSAGEIFQQELARLKGQEQRATSDAERFGLGFAKDAKELQKRASAKKFLLFQTDSFLDANPTTRFSSPSDLGNNAPSPGIFSSISYDDEFGADLKTNYRLNVEVSPVATKQINIVHPHSLIIGEPNSFVQIRSQASEDPSWVDAMQKEMQQFKFQNVWILIDLPEGKYAIGTKWILKNKRDARGIVVRNKARLVAQGHKQEEGIDYDESAFLYGSMMRSNMSSQPKGFMDPQYPKKVYKVVKALYGLHQAPRAWYATLSTFLLKHRYKRGTIDKTLFLKKHKRDIILVQVYVDDIIFGSTKKAWCDDFEALMKGKFEMSAMGELIFFLGLQVQQRPDGIFIGQDKYVQEILKKFDLESVRTATTPYEAPKPKSKNEPDSPVNVHLYRSMIGSLMYLTASRPDIMFAVSACSRNQVTPTTSNLEAVKKIFKYLKGQPRLGLWYPRESPFVLEAYSDSDYAGANKDRKSTTGGCQFLGRRLISWQCKKQTIVATSSTEAEYVAAANCCGQVLWIQNQLLDYGYNFMNTKIFIDNQSTICIVKNPVFHQRTKHIEIRHHFIRDANEKKLIQVLKIHTDDNVADLLTKAFDGPRFTHLVVNIGMLNP